MAVVEVEGLTKRYGSGGIEDISFEAHEAEIVGLVGPNGAGKTTTLECIAGLRAPDAGRICVLGLDPRTDRVRLAQVLGLQLQHAAHPDRLRVGEAVALYAGFYEHPADGDALLARFGLAEHRRKPYAKLSGGLQQRLNVVLALIGNPRVVVLDELTTGLDPHARRDMWELVAGLRETGKTVLLSTHFMDEAERLCDRVAVLHRGRVVALDRPAALIADTSQTNLEDAYLRADRGHGLMRGTLRLAKTELLLFMREPVAVFFTLAFPLVFLTIFGVGSDARARPALDGKNALDVMVPAFAALVAATAGINTVAIQLAAQRERGMLRRLRATPLDPLALFVAVGAAVTAITAIGLGLLLVEGTVLGLSAPANPLVFAVGLALTVAAMLGIGFVLGAVLPSERVAVPVALVVFMPMIQLSGATQPWETMSPALRAIGEWTPLRPAVELLRGAWEGAPADVLVPAAATLLVMAVAGTALAVRWFRWSPAT